MSKKRITWFCLLFLLPMSALAIEPQTTTTDREGCHNKRQRLGVVIETDCYGLDSIAFADKNSTKTAIPYNNGMSFNKDRDNDHIIRPNDHCLDSKPGRPVDPYGCQPFFFYTLAKVYFNFDKDLLTKRGKKSLNRAVRSILGNPDIRRVVIRGNADYIGSDHYNDLLSDRRVKRVYDYLTSNGIPEDWIYPRGLGEHFPIDENWTRLGRMRNRHVELLVFELE